MKTNFFLILVFTARLLSAQESNYWNAQFGAKSTLLGGAAVSSYLDNGALYYNPATLCFKDSGDLAVSANIYQVEDIRMKNYVGDGIDVTSYNYVISPQIISGNLMLTRKMELGFIFLTKQNVDFSLNKSHSGTYSLYPPADSILPFNFIADYTLRNRIIEQWGGIALSYTLNKNWGIGITNFFGYRYQKFSKSLTATAIYSDTAYINYGGYVEKNDYQREISYDNFNDIVKLGIAYTSKSINMGLALTLPSVNIFGRGKSNYYSFNNNISSLQTSSKSQSSNLVFDKESRLPVVYKTPLSASFGIAYKSPKTEIYFSAEYFFPLAPYDLIQPQHNHNPSTVKNSVQYNSADVVGVTKSANALLNFGVGIEQNITKKFAVLVGFHSDYNSSNAATASQNRDETAVSFFNIWHGTIGVSFKHNKQNVTFGLAGAYGTIANQPQAVNFTSPTDQTFLWGTTSNTSASFYRSLGMVLGVVF